MAGIARIGKGGNDRYFYGLHLLLVVSARGVATGWTLAAGNIQDRWLAELLLSSRAGQPQLTGPQTAAGTPRLIPPSDWIGPGQSCGRRRKCPVLADLGYAGDAWRQHWQDYAVDVLTPPVWERHSARVWLSSVCQAVETALALIDSCGLQFPRAHCTWGLLTRISVKIAAWNVGILVNRHFDRPDLAFATLVV